MARTDRLARVVTVLGTRPELIKCSALIPLFDDAFEHVLVHTGQHYDDVLDGCFFRDLRLREPDYRLNVGSGAHGPQVAQMLLGLEPILAEHEPDWVFVQGDTNSTLAGSLAGAKRGHRVAHLEAGCRSFNRAMPEELNRVLVDHMAALCLAPDGPAVANLLREGIPVERIVEVGSTGVDACLRMRALLPDDVWAGLPAPAGERPFLVATIHRAENTTPARLAGLIAALDELNRDWPVIFPVHPRTAVMLRGLELRSDVHFVEPLGYPQMVALVSGALALLTDSGGLQEESAVLGTPTFILRNETEWTAFVEAGRHQLVGVERDGIVRSVRTALADPARLEIMRQPIGLERAGASQQVLAALTGAASDRTG
jgi:UDP-N-acetylglucosamine 2-epimerase (non-hydrolysing)